MRVGWLGIVGVGGLLLVCSGGVGAYVYKRHSASQGTALSDPGHLREALVSLRGRIARDPTDAGLHLDLGRLDMRLADPVAAEKEFRRARELGSPARAMEADLGRSLLQQQRYGEVLQAVPASGTTTAATAGNLLLRAEAQLAEHDVAAARAGLAASRRLAPEEADTFVLAARIAAATGSAPSETEALVDAALRRASTNMDALTMKIGLLARRGNPAEAVALADHALSSSPWSAELRVSRAYLLASMGEDGRAQSDVSLVLQGQPSSVNAVYLDGVLAMRRGDGTRAVAQLSRLNGVTSQFPQVLLFQAQLALEQKQPETASELARRYTVLVPSDPEGIRLRGEIELASGRAVDVLPAVRDFAVANPDALPVQLTYARLLIAVRDLPSATRVLLRLEGLPTLPASLSGELGLALLQAGHPEDALPVLERAAGMQPARPEGWQMAAQAAIEAKRDDEASAALSRLRALPGTDAIVGNLSGMLKLRDGDEAGAVDDWSAVISRHPDATEARFNLAQARLRQGALDEALDQLRAVLRQDPADIRALQLFAKYSNGTAEVLLPRLRAANLAQPRNPVPAALLADFLVTTGNPDAALGVIQRVNAGAETPTTLLPVLGRAQAAAGRPDDAIETLRLALDAHPDDKASRSSLVRLVRARQGDTAAAELLRQGIRANPGDLSQMWALVVFVQQTRGIDAAMATAGELRADPANRPAADGLRGVALMAAGRYGDARKAYEDAFAEAPSSLLAQDLATAHEMSGDGEGAQRVLRGWVAGNPGDAAAWSLLARIEMRARDYAAAAASLRSALRLRPGDPDTTNSLAWAYYRTHDRRAGDTARQAYLLSPSADSADTLGWILLEAGNAAGAISLLRSAYERRPGDAMIAYHLASALAADGQPSAAFSVLRGIPRPQVESLEDRNDVLALLERVRDRP